MAAAAGPLALVLLVYVPCAIGVKAAGGRLTWMVVIGLFAFVVAVVPVPVVLEASKALSTASSAAPVLAMAGVWLVIGLALGRQAKSYLRLVGRPGFVFAICSVVIVVCLDGIVVDAPVEWVKSHDFHHAATLFGGYCLFLSTFLFIMLYQLGASTTDRALRRHARRLFKIFTIVGLLEAGSKYISFLAASRLLWWVPNVEPPWPMMSGSR